MNKKLAERLEDIATNAIESQTAREQFTLDEDAVHTIRAAARALSSEGEREPDGWLYHLAPDNLKKGYHVTLSPASVNAADVPVWIGALPALGERERALKEIQIASAIACVPPLPREGEGRGNEFLRMLHRIYRIASRALASPPAGTAESMEDRRHELLAHSYEDAPPAGEEPYYTPEMHGRVAKQVRNLVADVRESDPEEDSSLVHTWTQALCLEVLPHRFHIAPSPSSAGEERASLSAGDRRFAAELADRWIATRDTPTPSTPETEGERHQLLNLLRLHHDARQPLSGEIVARIIRYLSRPAPERTAQAVEHEVIKASYYSEPMCRDCADEAGTCPNTGDPCDLYQRALVMLREAAAVLSRPEGEPTDAELYWRGRAMHAERRLSALPERGERERVLKEAVRATCWRCEQGDEPTYIGNMGWRHGNYWCPASPIRALASPPAGDTCDADGCDNPAEHDVVLEGQTAYRLCADCCNLMPVDPPPAGKEPEGERPWCQPGDDPTRRWVLWFEDADRGPSVFADEAEARAAYQQASHAWNCYLLAAVPRVSRPAPEREREAEEALQRISAVWSCTGVVEALGEFIQRGFPLPNDAARRLQGAAERIREEMDWFTTQAHVLYTGATLTREE